MIVAGIVAGGTGSRMGMGMPKQFLDMGGMPILMHTVKAFASHEQVDCVVIGAHVDWVEHTQTLIRKYCREELWCKIAVVPGGAQRNDTLLAILQGAREHFGAGEDAVILSHDAVRPFVTKEIISAHVEAMARHRVVTTTIPAVDTMLLSADGLFVTEVPNRSMMFHAQTPQSFRMKDFEELYMLLDESEKERATDVCGIYLQQGIPVYMVKGESANRKITLPEDYKELCQDRRQ